MHKKSRIFGKKKCSSVVCVEKTVVESSRGCVNRESILCFYACKCYLQLFTCCVLY